MLQQTRTSTEQITDVGGFSL